MGSVFPDRKSPRLPHLKKTRDRAQFDPMYVFWGSIDRTKIPGREDTLIDRGRDGKPGTKSFTPQFEQSPYGAVEPGSMGTKKGDKPWSGT